MNHGEIIIEDGIVFKWMMSGETIKEIYGWIERNGSVVHKATGYYRTEDPEKACAYAKLWL